MNTLPLNAHSQRIVIRREQAKAIKRLNAEEPEPFIRPKFSEPCFACGSANECRHRAAA
jgi:hypothetical protein